MVAKLHAIAGLPRSGSTLLAALLRQNPRFTAGMTTPVFMLCASLLEQMSGVTEFNSFFTEERRRSLLHGVIDGYYPGKADDNVVFDTNRLWAGKVALLKELFPKSRLICCVRDIGWILDSIERMLRKNPLYTSRLFSYKAKTSVYARTSMLMHVENGLVGQAWAALHEAWQGEDARRLIIVRYESLASNPAAALDRIYHEIGEPMFAHDFENLAYSEPDYDDLLGIPGMHEVRRSVALTPREPTIPPDLFKRHDDLSFWNKPDANRRGVLVI